MARQKNPEIYVIKTEDQVSGALEELASIHRKLGLIEATMNEGIDRQKAEAKQATQPLQSRRQELATALEVFATFHKDRFATKRTAEYAHGRMGWRKSSKLGLSGKGTWAQVLGKLKELAFFSAIKVKEDVNKEDLETWPVERLKLVGVERETTDQFWYEIKQEELPPAA